MSMIAEIQRRRKRNRLMIIGGIGLVLAAAAALVLFALEEEIVFFRTPTDIAKGEVLAGTTIRIGGLVADGSVEKEDQNVRFTVTDGSNSVAVTYVGLLPDLFREGQGVVADGQLNAGGTFEAATILAKHDENYMPSEVAEALKEGGVWKGEVQ